ncbi:MAG: DUF4418 family protein [Lachnospiraceae bacterium]|nr:DUF4418 family protein [Lachnospiraceae bacterium]
MKTKLTTIVNIIEILCTLAIFGTLKIWAPVCDKMLTLETGKQVFMKCHYTGQAAIVIAVILIVVAVVGLLSKKDQKLIHFIAIACGVMLFLTFTKLIGVCVNKEMSCITTALWMKMISAVIVIAPLIDIIFDKEGQVG